MKTRLICQDVFAKFTSVNRRIALQVARKIAPCDMTLSSMSKFLTNTAAHKSEGLEYKMFFINGCPHYLVLLPVRPSYCVIETSKKMIKVFAYYCKCS